VGGLRIAPGDLIHGDMHGVLRVPLNIANEIPALVGKIREQERRVIQYCLSPKFNIGDLRSIVANNPCGVPGDEVSKVSEISKPN
jgi:4-hydroxy-4-methyl-2-oxoglutarate aldolase